MNETDVIQLIGTVGFPIVAYLLVYLDLSKSVKELTLVVKELCTKVGELKK